MVQVQISDHAKTAGDVVAAGLTIAVVAKWLPAIAAFLTIVWTAIRIYETETVQRIVRWVVRQVAR